MFKVHGFLDDKMVIKQRMDHLPRCGDTVRLSGERYAKVTEVIWCMDEPDCELLEKAQRINLRMESIGIETPNACSPADLTNNTDRLSTAPSESALSGRSSPVDE